ncbi:MAG: Mfa1 fimbrilin C-terminal domain-containing protein [Muribaculaceae bacterium]|nr:Mfa1 fimbrilin C-terminal domain-containing protein [Muribaculaceae bacterium]
MNYTQNGNHVSDSSCSSDATGNGNKDLRKNPARFNRAARVAVMMLLLFVASVLAGCSHDSANDEPYPGEEENFSIENLYLQLHLNLPTGTSTKSVTDNTKPGDSTSGQLNGQTNENKISLAYLFFYDITGAEEGVTNVVDGRLVCSVETSSIESASSGSGYDVYAKMEKEDLIAMAGKKLRLYVIGNMYLPYSFNPESESELLGSSFEESEIGSYTKSFGNNVDGKAVPLSNQTYYELDLTKLKLADGVTDDANNTQLLELIKKLFTGEYTDELGEKGLLWDASTTTSYKDGDKEIYTGNGTLSLERMVARVDYKSTNNDIFPLPAYDNAGNEDVYLKIVSMQLFNMGKKAYLFRHTAAGNNEAATGNPQPFGKEKDNGGVEAKYNWIADSDWGSKDYFNMMTSSAGKDENGNDVTLWSFTGDNAYLRTSALSGMPTVDNGYKPWMYIMENTVSKTADMSLQYNTGIEFRMVACKADGTPIEKLTGTEPYRITLTDGAASGKATWYKEPAWVDAVTDGTTVLEPGGYYLTYRYLIDHNNESENNSPQPTIDPDTGKISNPAPMQYAIVRNNVYRISVTGIKSLPDPHEPDNYYLSVEIKVLPWVRRSITVAW